ncbi:AI-2E family transporter [Pedobacter sp.]|uniref:AI-2E family transporter n=1 Tax=Pedobacter sp. TaxID=1411316 RepID=UPI003BA8F965
MIQYHSTPSRSVAETVISMLALLALLYALFEVLKVFFCIFTFALIFYASFSTAFEKLVRLFLNRRKIAGFIYSLVLIGIVALPFIFMITALGKHVKEVFFFVEEVKIHGIPPLPEQVTRLPYAGDGIADFWHHLQQNPKETVFGYEHQIKNLLHHLLTGGMGILGTGIQLISGIILSAIFLAGGKDMLKPFSSGLQRLLGKRDGVLLLDATAHAIKGVSIGVIGTAFFAAALSWIGFGIAGIHFKFLLTALVFILVLLQMGPLFVWVPLIIWISTHGQTGTTIFVAVYGLCLFLAEALVRPILIARSGGKLPFLVLFIGVIGGLAAWGFTGMFKGAIIMAVGYTIFNSWLKRNDHQLLRN